AREGAVGVIHRFLSIKDEANEVEKVKRAESVFIEMPYIVRPDQKICDVKELMSNLKISGFPVVDSNYRVVGILTKRDIQFEDDGRLVKDVMTKNPITGMKGICAEKAKEIMIQHKIEKLPIVDEQCKLQGLFTAKDILKTALHPNATKDKKGKLVVGAAIGVKKDFIERAKACIDVGTDFLVIDIAHGHSENALRALRELKKNFHDIPIVVGNVATAEGTEELISAGADCVKVGVGAGSACITRIMAGSGVPQITAIMESASVAEKYGVPIIADGGMRNSGDLAKAIAAGADVGMFGQVFAGTEESPGEWIFRNGKKYKVYRGMASFGASLGRKERTGEITEHVTSEGVEALVPYRGTVKEVLMHLVGGLRSGMSYCGARNINEFHKKARFIMMTSAGVRESYPHDINLI
ncbi:MAG: IMP dehydrogenase, partial [Candidatus Woesearchaeota archaeon]